LVPPEVKTVMSAQAVVPDSVNNSAAANIVLVIPALLGISSPDCEHRLPEVCMEFPASPAQKLPGC